MPDLNMTHDPARRSWVRSANTEGADFPIQNLPFGVFRRDGERPRGGIAIGDQIVDLAAAVAAGLFRGEAEVAATAASAETLNTLMALGNGLASSLRHQVSDLLSADDSASGEARANADQLLVAMAEAEMLLPARIGAFTDMMTSTYHVSGGRRGSPPRQPSVNFRHMPIGYNSRASSIVVSGNPIRRPCGVYEGGDGAVIFGPEPRQDYEMELAAWIGPGNPQGTTIPIAEASDHIFGYSLLNDWSARGIQFFEVTPLGPFLGKSFATTVSPWIVTAEALAPFTAPAFPRGDTDPALLPHLTDPRNAVEGGLDLKIESWLSTEKMRARGDAPLCICRTNTRHLYWTFAQMVAQHVSNGCNLCPADIVASGTVSGPTDEMCGCLLELTARGTLPFDLPGGESRLFLEDGDEVILRGRAERDSFVGISLGEARGVLLPRLT